LPEIFNKYSIPILVSIFCILMLHAHLTPSISIYPGGFDICLKKMMFPLLTKLLNLIPFFLLSNLRQLYKVVDFILISSVRKIRVKIYKLKLKCFMKAKRRYKLKSVLTKILKYYITFSILTNKLIQYQIIKQSRYLNLKFKKLKEKNIKIFKTK